MQPAFVQITKYYGSSTDRELWMTYPMPETDSRMISGVRLGRLSLKHFRPQTAEIYATEIAPDGRRVLLTDEISVLKGEFRPSIPGTVSTISRFSPAQDREKTIRDAETARNALRQADSW